MGFLARSVTRLVVVSVLLIPQFFCEKNTCPPPDFPERGLYDPKKEIYDAGNTVVYSCIPRYLILFVEHDDLHAAIQRSTCESNGKWSGVTPLCDTETTLGVTKADKEKLVLVDGRLNTCIGIEKETEEILQFSFQREGIPYAIIMCFGEGSGKVELSLPPNDGKRQYEADHLEKTKCKVLDVRSSYVSKTDNIRIKVSTLPDSTISVCEIEVYTRGEKWCLHSPNKSVANGQLEVSQIKAVLHCNEGFKEKNGRDIFATCEDGKWSFRDLQCVGDLCDPVFVGLSSSEGEWVIDGGSSDNSIGAKRTLKCKPGYHSEEEPLTVECLKNRTWTQTSATCIKNKLPMSYIISGIVVGCVIVLIVVVLVGVKIYLAPKKDKGVVVVYKGQNNSYSMPPFVGDLSTTGFSQPVLPNVYIT